MKKVAIISRHGTCYLDYRITSQAIFLKNSGFNVTVVETYNLFSKKNTLYKENKVPVIEVQAMQKLALKKKGLLKFFGLQKALQKNFKEIRPKVLREILRLVGFHKIMQTIIAKQNKILNTTQAILESIKPEFIITRDLLDEAVISYKIKNPAVKIIADLHEVYYFQKGCIDEKLKTLQDAELKHASYIINVTPQITQTYYKHFLDEGRAIVIPNAPSLSLTPSTKPKFRQNKTVRFLCHGSYFKSRDAKVVNFLKDFIKHSPNHFEVYLRFLNKESHEVKELEAFCQKTNAKERIFFLDSVEGINAEVSSMVDSYDIGICLLNAELGGQYTMASPNRFGTYTHAGLAILTNESLFIGELVTKNNLGFVAQNNNFKEAIKFIANNPEKVAEWRQNAYKFAKESFNYEFYGKELLKLLK